MGTIKITVTDAAGATRNQVTAPDDAPSIRIIGKLAQELKLPLNSPDGTPMSYKFHHVETTKQIGEGVTLKEAGVLDGHTLKLMPEIIAG